METGGGRRREKWKGEEITSGFAGLAEICMFVNAGKGDQALAFAVAFVGFRNVGYIVTFGAGGAQRIGRGRVVSSRASWAGDSLGLSVH
jgi:hypothetical protein